MPLVKLDAIDLRILREIRENGRITKLVLAERVGLSPTPCWMRLRRLEKAGVVTGYHASLALRLIGPFTLVFVEIELAEHRHADFDRFEAAITLVPEIVNCWALGGGIDYLLKVMAKDIDAYQRLVDRLLERDIGISRYYTYIVTRTVKDEDLSPLDALVAQNA